MPSDPGRPVRTSAKFDPDAFVVRADVHLADIEPPITRVLELPRSLNLAQLHEVLQAVFGWTDSHLHQFVVGGLVYGPPEFDPDGELGYRISEASRVTLADFTFTHEERWRVVYEYDFGDGWWAVLNLTRVERDKDASYPRCVAGTRAGPPDDCGGPLGYADFVEVLRNPRHRRHAELRGWAGPRFDPERFNLDETNKAIDRALRRARGGYRFRRER